MLCFGVTPELVMQPYDNPVRICTDTGSIKQTGYCPDVSDTLLIPFFFLLCKGFYEEIQWENKFFTSENNFVKTEFKM